MDSAWSEYAIARAISLQTLQRKCVLLVDNCNWTGHECDVLGVTTNLRLIDIEVKISRADLKADSKKDKWWHRMGWGSYDVVDGKRTYVPPPSVPRVHPPKVWKHYYALPAEIWKPELVDSLPSKASGVLLLRRGNHRGVSVVVECARRATPDRFATRLTAEDVMDIARLANLRMWEAYRRRDDALRGPTAGAISAEAGGEQNKIEPAGAGLEIG